MSTTIEQLDESLQAMPGDRMTALEFEHAADTNGLELFNGIVRKRKPMDQLESWVAGETHRQLSNHVTPKRLGWVYNSEVGYRCFDDVNHRKADVSFVSIARQPTMGGGALTIPPDLAVEVVSPTDVYLAVQANARLYLSAGVKIVWIIDPVNRIVEILAAGKRPVILIQDDTLEATEILPGFAVQVSNLFPPTVAPMANT